MPAEKRWWKTGSQTGRKIVSLLRCWMCSWCQKWGAQQLTVGGKMRGKLPQRPNLRQHRTTDLVRDRGLISLSPAAT